MKIAPTLRTLAPVLLALALAAPAAANETGLRRPDGWDELPKSERPWVWVIDLDYRPEPEPQAPFDGRRIALLPIHNSSSIDAHLDVPLEKFRKEKVIARLDDEQRSRVLSLQVMSRPWKGKPSSAILTSRPFDELLFEAISRELEALGAEVVPPPIDAAPITSESFARLVADLPRDEGVDFYLAVKIEDLHVRQYYRCCRTDELGKAAAQLAQALFDTPTYTTPQELIPMATVSFDLSLRLADASAGKVRWEGRSRLDHSEAGPAMIYLLEWWERLVRSSFPDLIERSIRDNEDLHDAIEPTTYRVRRPPRRAPISIANAGAPETELAAASPSERAAPESDPPPFRIKLPPPDPSESEPPPIE